MLTKAIPSVVSAIDGRKVVGLASVFGVLDDTYPKPERVLDGAFKKTIKERFAAGRIKHFWSHERWNPPTALVFSLREVGREELPKKVIDSFPEATGGLEIGREYLQTIRGDEALEGVVKGAITEMSFGYDVLRSKPALVEGIQSVDLSELGLWETSDVNWGANEATIALKAAVPYADHGVTDEGTAWKKPSLGDFTDKQWEELDESEKRRIMAHFAWSSSNPAEKFEDLKLPHHLVKKAGVGPAVWNGVRSAMSVLMGGMGGVDIPEGERKATYNHLAKHYPAWEKEPPDYKLASLAFLMREIAVPGGFATGRLQAKDLESLDRVRKEFQEILLSAEPSAADDAGLALTERMRWEIKFREREILHHIAR